MKRVISKCSHSGGKMFVLNIKKKIPKVSELCEYINEEVIEYNFKDLIS